MVTAIGRRSACRNTLYIRFGLRLCMLASIERARRQDGSTRKILGAAAAHETIPCRVRLVVALRDQARGRRSDAAHSDATNKMTLIRIVALLRARDKAMRSRSGMVAMDGGHGRSGALAPPEGPSWWSRRPFRRTAYAHGSGSINML